MQASREVLATSTAGPVASDIPDIIAEAKSLQNAILRDIIKAYPKAFNQSYSSLFNASRFDKVKRPLAKALKALCEMQLTSVTDVAYFIAYYNHARNINIANDPKGRLDGLFDKMRRKPLGGELGGIIDRHYHQIEKLKVYLISHNNDRKVFIKWRLALLYQHLAKAREMEYAQRITADFRLLSISKLPAQSYHQLKLHDLEERFGLSQRTIEESGEEKEEEEDISSSRKLALEIVNLQAEITSKEVNLREAIELEETSGSKAKEKEGTTSNFEPQERELAELRKQLAEKLLEQARQGSIRDGISDVGTFKKLKEALAVEISELRDDSTDVGRLKSFIAILNEKIRVLRQERITLDIIDSALGSDSHDFLTCSHEERIKNAVRAELIHHFTESLLSEEKLFFWMLSVRTRVFSRVRQAEKHAVVFGKTDLCQETQRYYDCEGYSPLLSNHQFHDSIANDVDIKGVKNDNDVTSLAIDAITEELESHLSTESSRLRDLRVLENKELWRPLFGEDGFIGQGYKWTNRLENFVNRVLLRPLSLLDEMVDHLEIEMPSESQAIDAPDFNVWDMLPLELYPHILQHLNGRDLFAFILTSKAMAATLPDLAKFVKKSDKKEKGLDEREESPIWRDNLNLISQAARTLMGLKKLDVAFGAIAICEEAQSAKNKMTRY